MARERALSIVAVLLALHVLPVAAQSLDVVLLGKVSDQTGGSLPGAMVTVTSDATGFVRSATTDGDGHYTLVNLPASTYDVRAAIEGFAARVLRRALPVGSTVRLDFALSVASVAETLDVRGGALLLETSRNTQSRVIERDEIDTLPVISRNFNDLAALAPGVTKTGVYGGVDISGSRDFQNAYQVDGVSAKRQRLGDQRLPYAQDWIQEFQVLTGQFDAEFGPAAGGVINVVTRSGANRLAGRVYGFVRNDAWDASPTFVSRKPPLSEDRVGATAGGPFVKGRVFYFAGIERFGNESSNVVKSSFPEANGTFPATDSQTLSLGKVDVATTDRQRVRVRYSGQRANGLGSAVGGISTEEHGRAARARANDFVGNWTSIVAPTVLNELRAAWSTSVAEGACNYAASHPPGTWFERSYPGAQFGCPVNFGSIGEDQFQLVENLSWTRGRHDVKLGAQTFWTRTFGDFRNLRDGRYSFERDVPFSLANANSYPFSFSRIEGPTVWDLSAWSTGVFAQDAWRARDDVTLHLGVRYDLDGSLTALNPMVRLDKGLHTIQADRGNIAPRAAVAWTPFHDQGRTVLRGGAGVYYDQNHNNVTTGVLLNNILVDRVTSLNANNALLNPFWPDVAAAKRLLAEALAEGRTPDLSVIPGLAGSTNDVDAALEIPASVHASAGVVREVARWLSLSADFVHARGFDLYVIRDVNIDPATFRRPNANYGAISTFGNGGWSRYRALQVQAHVLPGAGQLLKIGYTLAGSRSNTNATLSTGTVTNPFDYAEDEGPADNDVRHTLAINGSAALPLRLRLSGIFNYRSALPFSPVTNAARPDGKPFAYRPAARNSDRGDSAASLDLRLAKIVRLGARATASAFVEVFNVTNAVNYGDYIGTVTSSLFGQPTTAGPRRRTQVGFRLDF